MDGTFRRRDEGATRTGSVVPLIRKSVKSNGLGPQLWETPELNCAPHDGVRAPSSVDLSPDQLSLSPGVVEQLFMFPYFFSHNAEEE